MCRFHDSFSFLFFCQSVLWPFITCFCASAVSPRTSLYSAVRCISGNLLESSHSTLPIPNNLMRPSFALCGTPANSRFHWCIPRRLGQNGRQQQLADWASESSVTRLRGIPRIARNLASRRGWEKFLRGTRARAEFGPFFQPRSGFWLLFDLTVTT